MCVVCEPTGICGGAGKNCRVAALYERADEEIEAGSIVFCHVDRDGGKARRDCAAFFAGDMRRPAAMMLGCSVVGTPEDCREMLQHYVEHGLTKFALWSACLPSQLLRQLTYYSQDIIPYFEQRHVPTLVS